MCQVENVQMNLRQYQSGLIFYAAYIRTIEFSNKKIEKMISQRDRSYYFYKLR